MVLYLWEVWNFSCLHTDKVVLYQFIMQGCRNWGARGAMAPPLFGKLCKSANNDFYFGQKFWHSIPPFYLRTFLYEITAFEIHPKLDNFYFPSKYNVNLIWYTFKPFRARVTYECGHVPLFDLALPLFGCFLHP